MWRYHQTLVCQEHDHSDESGTLRILDRFISMKNLQGILSALPPSLSPTSLFFPLSLPPYPTNSSWFSVSSSENPDPREWVHKDQVAWTQRIFLELGNVLNPSQGTEEINNAKRMGLGYPPTTPAPLNVSRGLAAGVVRMYARVCWLGVPHGFLPKQTCLHSPVDCHLHRLLRQNPH